MLRIGRFCAPCQHWCKITAQTGPCVRCGHLAAINRNELCRLCLLTIRTIDKTWLATRENRCCTQQFLLLDNLPLPIARALDREPSTPHTFPSRNPWWVSAALGAVIADDPSICPPLPPDQLLLVQPRREFTEELASRIADRTRRQFPEIDAAVEDYASASRSRPWCTNLRRLTGLILAAAHADGLMHVPAHWLQPLPLGSSIGAVLQRLSLLSVDATVTGAYPTSPPRRARPRPVQRQAVSCRDCESWGMTPLCEACDEWAKTHPLGQCGRCRRHDIAVGEHQGTLVCRSCLVIARYGPYGDGATWAAGRDPGITQLTLGGKLAPRLHTRAGWLGYRPGNWKSNDLKRARAQAVTEESAHLVRAGQLMLFSAQRDWTPVAHRSSLPALTPAAQYVIDDIDRMAREYTWNPESLSAVKRTLRILLSWLGAESPILEDDVRALQQDYPAATTARVLLILAEHHLLVRSADAEKTANQRWVETQIDALGDSAFTAELRTWIRVMRGEGRRRRHPRSWEVIHNYLQAVLPTLRSWNQDLASLREATPGHVQAALQGLNGTSAQGVRTGLRSIFVALRQQRVVFRDPTRAVRLGSVVTLPTALHDDQLRGLIERGRSPLEQAILALVAIHAVHVRDLRSLALDDIDFARSTITIVRPPSSTRVVHLDALTARLLADWLRERNRRWPATDNERVFITANGAFSIQRPPVSTSMINAIFRRLDLTPRQVRIDRILYEAGVTADPVHLMQVFGISVATAVRYVHAAHPERSGPPKR
ncbi:hypothetical protein A5731_08225 [Mycolicibacterium conceptionense]|uniref:Site-specific recombinase XerD n=3 Tax=Mycolicibacterium conceptionense TaxID=451644 RepID=A0A0J8WU12_9MYCO|nr:hypothetical protein ACT17_20000 [Mycolicibacterium conceptionense]OBB11443.1 hypothetical protein A5718_06595 [Mycolicibacterium conceptionense]OBF06976.1 hypothetical protein A5731_08225 [Mycolicibacterium conceptionense]OBF26607.1 hypothetical protein A5726_05400 [Mycolicibacterium conceptionense]OBF31148.1 hypothetical protein A5720_28735 [Mycolicibacterium conceptionense]